MPRLLGGLVALGAALVMAPSASAATTIGELPSGAGDDCGGGTVFLQANTFGPGPSYTVPAGGGVITSWNTKTGAGAGQAGALKVLTITDTTHYTVAGSSPLTPLTASTTNTFGVRIRVAGGEILGYYFPAGNTQKCHFPTTQGGDLERFKSGAYPDPAVGEAQVTNATGAATRVNIRAVVEPDADKDGFGDETQDLCPGNAGGQIGCPAQPTTGAVTPLIPADRTKPKLGSLRFSSTTFKAASSGASISAKSKAKVGTKVSFNLSEPSSVKFTVERKTKGRKSGKKCVAKRKSNARKKACTHWVKATGSFTYSGKAGKNTFKFRGRVGGKRLKPGSYRLNSQATDKARNKSASERKSFTIVR